MVDIEERGENDRLPELWLVLYLWLYDATLSRLRIILCRAVRCSTFFSALGKNSVRWFVMSSLGGR